MPFASTITTKGQFFAGMYLGWSSLKLVHKVSEFFIILEYEFKITAKSLKPSPEL
jgi:hypothetical protein